MHSIFGPDGPLARDLSAYRFRPQQLAMAEAIALAIETRGQLLAEAGTGTGKTFAYLVPALLSGGKVIVSTGTKTLQDQLFQRDLPLIRDALKVPVSVALLKGRGNYVCHHHLERASAQGTFSSRADAAYLPRIASFARTSTTGDKSELADVPENAGIWADVTSTRENCLGSECADYDRCFVMNARKQALAALGDAPSGLARELGHQAERSNELAQCATRAADSTARLTRWREGLRRPKETSEDSEWIRWLDVRMHGWQLRASPLSVAEIFSKQVTDDARAWIFTSATLAISGDFALYQRELGLGGATSGYWESPFDYAQQSLLYLPRDLPPPNSIEHTEAVVAAALPVLKASGGRAFLLFTTLRALARARESLAAAMEREGMRFPLLVQGEGSRSELLTRFRRLGNAVLLGSQSFWEGVDVQGEALSVVIIDKLPFAPPDDPLFAARLEHIAREGGNPFMDYHLPQAAISLKQGAGRLIRSETDRGVLMICDRRLVEKPYGRRIWQALPPMRRTRELADVEEFFAALPAEV